LVLNQCCSETPLKILFQQHREAKDFLRDRLSAGPVNSADIIDEARQEGIAKRTLDRAKKDLRIKSRKQRGSPDGTWVWELPPKGERWQPS